eukprot:8461785-Karenia_brevis.AAC.1
MDPNGLTDALKMTDGINGGSLKTTKSQHDDAGQSLSVNASSTWHKLFPQSSPANEDKHLKAWCEHVYGLALHRSGLR